MKSSVALSLPGKNTAQFTPTTVATTQNSLQSSSGSTHKKRLNLQAMKIFNLYIRALNHIKNDRSATRISAADDKAFDLALINSIKKQIYQTLNEMPFSDKEEAFRHAVDKITAHLEDLRRQVSEEDKPEFVDLALIDEALKNLSDSEPPVFYERQPETTKIWWKKHQKNISGGAKFGALIALPVWALLLLKDCLVGVVIPGGPVFGAVSGLPVAVSLSALIFAATGAYMDVDFSLLLKEVIHIAKNEDGGRTKIRTLDP